MPMIKCKPRGKRPWMVRDVPEDIRRRFVGHCKVRGTTVTDEIVRFMETYIRESVTTEKE